MYNLIFFSCFTYRLSRSLLRAVGIFVEHWARALPLAGQEGGGRMSALLHHRVQTSETFGLSSITYPANDHAFICTL
jgi:hypothetical protein